jgi:hypothetical protein
LALEGNQRSGLRPEELRFILGAILALSLFFIEAGVAEILIGKDLACREALGRMRLAPDAFTACQPEWQWFMLRALARGWPWLVDATSPALVGWIVMGFYYAVLGGMAQQLSRRSGWIIFLALQVATVALVAGLGYVRQFIAF